LLSLHKHCTSSHHTWHLCKVFCKSHQGFKRYRADTKAWRTETDRRTDRQTTELKQYVSPFNGGGKQWSSSRFNLNINWRDVQIDIQSNIRQYVVPTLWILYLWKNFLQTLRKCLTQQGYVQNPCYLCAGLRSRLHLKVKFDLSAL